MRHLHTADLWVQDRLKAGDFSLRKTPSKDNVAGMMTKYLPRADLERHVGSMALHPEGGRAESAPRIAEDPVAQEETEKEGQETSHRQEQKEEPPERGSQRDQDSKQRSTDSKKDSCQQDLKRKQKRRPKCKTQKGRRGKLSRKRARCLEERVPEVIELNSVVHVVQESVVGHKDQVKPGKVIPPPP